ncbi:MAG TPA: reactive intermediate/imine deaminase [Synergistaceae bacterium]|nr:reactive intermediate/imine deaminase [Synergistaceae bacterium]
MKRIISTDKAPAAIGPYNQAIQAGNFLFCSGQIPIDPATGAMVEGGVGEQARQVLKNVHAVLEAAGYAMTDVIKATVFAQSMKDFAVVNEIYAETFKQEPPARSFIEVGALPKGALVEIEVIAWKG